MDYKDKIYERYISFQTQNIAQEQNLAEFEREFPVFESYYGRFLTNPEARVLDLACGNGNLVYWLERRGFENVQGIDLSLEQVRLAQRLGIKSIEQADLRAYLKNQEGQWEIIFALDIFEHFSKAEALEIFQLVVAALRPGGRLILKTPNGESIFSGRYAFSDFTHENIFTARSLREVLTFVGFKNLVFQEAAPVCHGLISCILVGLWQLIKLLLQAYILIETGQRAEILTQNVIAIAQK